MSQPFILAEIILLRAIRSKLVLSMLLLSLPVILAAYLFDSANPGFQTLFIKDIGGAFLTIFSLLLSLFMTLDNIFWKDVAQPEWFYLCRIKNRLNLFLGQCVGISVTILAGQMVLSSIFILLLRATHGVWFFELLFASGLIFLECSVFIALIILLSTMFSRFLSLSMGFLIYIVVSTSAIQALRESVVSDLSGFVVSLVLAIFPDVGMFSIESILLERQILNIQELLVSAFYAAFLIGFYLMVAQMLSSRRET